MSFGMTVSLSLFLSGYRRSLIVAQWRPPSIPIWSVWCARGWIPVLTRLRTVDHTINRHGSIINSHTLACMLMLYTPVRSADRLSQYKRTPFDDFFLIVCFIAVPDFGSDSLCMYVCAFCFIYVYMHFSLLTPHARPAVCVSSIKMNHMFAIVQCILMFQTRNHFHSLSSLFNNCVNRPESNHFWECTYYALM